MTNGVVETTTDPASGSTSVDMQTPEFHRRVVRSEDLLRGSDSVTIAHNGKLYVLHSLPNGRLILTGQRKLHFGQGVSRFPLR